MTAGAPAPLTDVAARVAALDPSLGFEVGAVGDEGGTIGSADGWTARSDLVADGEPTPRFVALVTSMAAAFPGGAPASTRARVAAARFCYLWSWRVVSSSLAALLVAGSAPDPAAANVAVQLWGTHPGAVRFGPDGIVAAAGGSAFDRWLDRMVGHHTDDLHRAVARHWNLGARGLMGDLATNVAGVFRAVGHATGDVVGAERGARTMLGRSPLAGLGDVCVIGAGGRHEVMYERLTCCLYVKVVPDAYCANCSLLSSDERSRRMTERAAAL